MAPIAVDATPTPDVFRVPASASSAPVASVPRASYEPTNRKLEDVYTKSNAGKLSLISIHWQWM